MKKLTHPDTDRVIETNDPEMYLSQGWTEAPSKTTKKAAPAAPPKKEKP